ncbi:hypothetical protein EV2_045966 [Malus domestica]
MVSDDLDVAVPATEDERFGFKRLEMFKEKLAGTVNAYDRHVLLCYKTPEAWLSCVEGSESVLLPKFFASALKARKNDIAVKVRFAAQLVGVSDRFSCHLTVIKGREGTEFSDGEVLIFPQMIKYSRDKRCGVCGPILIDKFKEEAELRGLTNQVFVTACSHIGGHKYAGNLIVYSPGSDGSITGHWYGYVTPEDVPELLD